MSNSINVLKFGGSSVKDAQAIAQVVDIVHSASQRSVVVVSAMGGITDMLIALGKKAEKNDTSYLEELKTIEQRHLEAVKNLVSPKRQSSVLAQTKILLNELEDVLNGIFLLQELTPRTLDYISSFGERLSSYIIYQAFIEKGFAAKFIDAREVIKTNEHFGKAIVDFKTTNELLQSTIQNDQANPIVMGGFIASTSEGKTTTLGRGGSDYTGAIVAAAIDAQLYEIWTDVEGMFTANPQKVPKAFPLEEISYEEAMELSFFGAKVIYPPSLLPVYQKQIPIRVKNTFKPHLNGTLISKEIKKGEKPIKGISAIPKIALLTLSGTGMVGVSGTAMRMFSALAKADVNVILISQSSSEHSITVAIAENEAPTAQKALEEAFEFEFLRGQLDALKIENQQCILAVVGENMKSTPGIAGKLFSALGRNGVNVRAVAQGASELNISMVISQKDEEKALRVIHEAFFLSDTKALHVFVVGTGQIGNTLLNQIAAQADKLLQKNLLEIRLCGITNSRKMLISEHEIGKADWKNALENQGKKSDFETFIEDMIALNLPNSVFVDCTASQYVSDFYERILAKSIAIVTPNKLAAAGDLQTYQSLIKLSRKRNTPFFYETNVGAGLPVISTLNDLLRSGDEVQRIEAILSGTLNFVLNNTNPNQPLSQTIRKAVEEGLAEPDPRIDLSCTDVARKILILARETGLKLSIEDVNVTPFIPNQYFENSQDAEDFMQKVAAFDTEFQKLLDNAHQNGNRLRVVATFEKQNGHATAKVALKEIERSHSFYEAEGSDNIILFSTRRYQKQPLVIKGAGAGAEVTAAGVFADIIRISM